MANTSLGVAEFRKFPKIHKKIHKTGNILFMMAKMPNEKKPKQKTQTQ